MPEERFFMFNSRIDGIHVTEMSKGHSYNIYINIRSLSYADIDMHK